MSRRPTSPDRNNVRTYYARPAVDRWTGRYTVEWENADGVQSIRRHNRLVDLEGHRPSLYSLMRLPKVVSTYVQAKRQPILPQPVPFLVLDAIRHLERIVRPGWRVLEAGGGNSTLWFLERGCRVTTLEHSRDWAGFIERSARKSLGAEAAERLELVVAEGESAVDHIADASDGKLDLVLVDCMNAFTWRRDCVAAARPRVAAGGWMCIDNSDHPNNWPAVELMADRQRIRFSGYAPMCPVVTQTSFWRM